MILEITLLVLIIVNLAWMSVLAFLGKKNLLIVFSLIEAILAVLFPLLVTV